MLQARETTRRKATQGMDQRKGLSDTLLSSPEYFRPHQRDIIRFMGWNTTSPGILLCHALGSGKSRSAVGIVEHMRWKGIVPAKCRVVVITKKTIRDSIPEEIKKMRSFLQIDDSLYTTTTYESFALHPDCYVDKRAPYLLIVDEAQHLSNSTGKRYPVVFDYAKYAEKVILLSGTPVMNYTREMGSLINLILASPGRKVPTKSWTSAENRGRGEQPYLPMTEGVWNRKYGKEGKNNRWHLKRYLKSLVSYFAEDTDSEEYKEHFPTVERKDVVIPMDKDHFQEYCKVESKWRPGDTFNRKTPLCAERRLWEQFFRRRGRARRRVAEEGEEKKSTGVSTFQDPRFLAYMMKLRMACNRLPRSQNTEDSEPYAHAYALRETSHCPKLRFAIVCVTQGWGADPTYKAVIYSNFLNDGVTFCAHYLEQLKIPFVAITGESTDQTITAAKRKYNSGKVRVLLLSSAGGQGLDLKGTSEFYEIEPHWNLEKLRQAEARVVRYDSHATCRSKKVRIIRLFTTIPTPEDSSPPKGPSQTADMYLKGFSNTKNDAVSDFMNFVSRCCVERGQGRLHPNALLKNAELFQRKTEREDVLVDQSDSGDDEPDEHPQNVRKRKTLAEEESDCSEDHYPEIRHIAKYKRTIPQLSSSVN